MTTPEQQIAERFTRETASHQITVLRDDGLYRHLRFSDEAKSLNWWDLITWPYNLIVNGSHGSHHFCRFGPDTKDMFALFRSGIWRDGSQHINPGYWAEKARAGKVKSWSEQKFRTWLVDEAASLESRHPGTVEAVGKQILHSDEHNTEYEETARYAVAQFSHGDVRLRFPDEWELSFEDFDWQYLWQCHAAVAGIAQYDTRKAASATSAEAVAR